MKNKKPLQRSILLGGILFITVLSLLLGLVTYREYRKALYSRYEAYISDVLTYVGSSIDVDDLKSCLDSGEKSEKYEELQAFIDHVKDTHRIDFLYVIIPQHLGEHDNIMNVIAAMSSYEKEHLPENEVELGGLTGDSYPAETAAKYYNAMDKDGIVFFEEVAEWGSDYTGILSLHTSDGAFFAELCVDVPVQEIHETIRSHMLVTLSMIIGLGVLFMFVFIYWSTRNIVSPIKRLEKSVAGFATRIHGQTLKMEDPDIHTGNELESLSGAVVQMADDINAYVQEVVEAQDRADRMTELANRDALTGIWNKGAFFAMMQEMQERVDRGETVEYGIGVFDCDDLKSVNDIYGHDKGDEYLKAASKAICRAFKHSTVFRIGGDEFAVVLTGEDFENRERLAAEFKEECKRSGGQNVWEQAHVTAGIAVFDPQLDRRVADTARRADLIMYENKRTGKKHKAANNTEE